MTNKVTIRHYANTEGRIALANGYTGCNPYRDESGDCKGSDKRAALQWAEGYTAAMRGRLTRGQTAIPTKDELNK